MPNSPARTVPVAFAQVTAAAVLLAVARRISVRWGVTTSDIARSLPGDELVPAATVVMDRATTLPCSAAAAYPWLVQLGKSRAGWYLPRRLEQAIIPRRRRAMRRIDPRLQQLHVGDRIPDWGPGNPEFEVASIHPDRALVFLSVRDPDDHWGWPASDPPWPERVLVVSWALCLDDVGADRCRLHTRLRANRMTRRMQTLAATVGGLADLLTLLGLFAGLRERTATPPAPR